MAVQMTRAEYEAKYGVAPSVPPINVSGIDTSPSVPKMTSAEYEVKYGVQPGQKRTLANLTINKYGLDEKPEYFGNPAETIRGAGEQVESAISGTGQFTGKGAGERGFAAASSAFLAVPSVVADVIPGGKKALEAISKTFEGGINIAGGIGYTLADTARSLGLMNDEQREAYDTRATNFAKTVSSTPLGVALESSANILKYAGDVANVLLMADGVARGTDNYLKNELPKQQAEAKTKIQKIQEQKQVLEVQKVADEIAAVESRYAKGRKANLYSKDAGFESRQRIASTGVLQGAVNKDGIVQTRGKGGAVEKYEAMTTKPAEGVVRLNLAKEGGKTKLSVVEAGLREQVMKSGLEGADLTAALNGVKKEIAGLRLKAENGYVPNTLLHDAKINTTKNINYQTPPETATYRKAIARGYKNLVEQNSNLPIKEINSELGKFYEDIARLESLDGMRVMGGKLGKYTAQISGNIAGATVGSLFGPLGMVVGTVVGGEVSSALKGSALARSFKGSGGTAPSSPVINQAVADANAPRLALPPNTSGFRSVRPSGEPIQLPARSQSAIDAKQVGATRLQVALSEAFSARGEGITISIRGDKPTSGFVYAPSKTTEFSVPAESFTRATLEEYVNKHYNELQKSGNYIGLWPDEGKIYMDISRVVPDESQAVKGAIDSQQLAIYDIGTGNTKYTRDYGYSDGSYIYRGKDKGAGDNGTGGTGNSSRTAEPTIEQTEAYSATPKTGQPIPDPNRIVVVSSPTNLHIGRQKKLVKNLTEEEQGAYLAHKAKTGDVFGEFETLYNSIREETGIPKQDFPANRKSDARAIEKGLDDYDGDFSRVKDMNRGAYVVDSTKEAYKILDVIKNKADVVSLKDRLKTPTSLGYGDLALNVRLSNGTVAELQILLSAMEKAKLKLHKYYETTRVLGAEMRKRPLTEEEIIEYNEALRRQVEGYATARSESR